MNNWTVLTPAPTLPDVKQDDIEIRDTTEELPDVGADENDKVDQVDHHMTAGTGMLKHGGDMPH